jgi:hypothetical protein
MAGNTTMTNSDGVSVRRLSVIEGMSLDNGTLTTDGSGNITAVSITAPSLFLPQSTVAAIANGSTIATANGGIARCTAAAACTGVIMALGTKTGQTVVVVNESAAANTITMAAAGTSNVAGGTTVSLAGLAAHLFVWDAGTSLWYQVGPATN